MPRFYGSFLVRCWRLDSGERRIDIEHIASGARVRVTSIASALKWIGGRVGDPLIAPASDARLRGAPPGEGSDDHETE